MQFTVDFICITLVEQFNYLNLIISGVCKIMPSGICDKVLKEHDIALLSI